MRKPVFLTNKEVEELTGKETKKGMHISILDNYQQIMKKQVQKYLTAKDLTDAKSLVTDKVFIWVWSLDKGDVIYFNKTINCISLFRFRYEC